MKDWALLHSSHGPYCTPGLSIGRHQAMTVFSPMVLYVWSLLASAGCERLTVLTGSESSARAISTGLALPHHNNNNTNNGQPLGNGQALGSGVTVIAVGGPPQSLARAHQVRWSYTPGCRAFIFRYIDIDIDIAKYNLYPGFPSVPWVPQSRPLITPCL